MRQTLLALLAVMIGCGSLAAEVVELHLDRGEIATGELIKQTDAEITLRRAMPQKGGGVMLCEISYQRASVLKIVRPEDEYRGYLAKVTDTSADDHGILALWCADKQLDAHAQEHARKALALNPAQHEARMAMTKLRFVEDHGTWTMADDYLKNHGLVMYGGKAMTPADRDLVAAATEAKNSAQAAYDQGQRAAQVQTKAQERLTALQAEKTTLNAAQKTAATSKSKATSAKALLTKIKAQAQVEMTQNGRVTTATQRAVAAAQVTYDQAEKAAATAAADELRATIRLTAIDKDIAAQQALVTAAQQQAKSSAPELDQAKAKLDEAIKHLAEVTAAIKPPADLPEQLR